MKPASIGKRNIGCAMEKMMRKKARSFKNQEIDRSGVENIRKKKLPNYMKPTSSSDARKEGFRENNLNQNQGMKKINRQESHKRLVKVIKRTSNVKPNVNRSTCSSTLKNSKFPSYVALQPGGTEAEGITVMKVCPYTYCSLNGEHDMDSTPLKRFIAEKRRLLKIQKTLKLGELFPKRKGNEVSNDTDDTGQVDFNGDSLVVPKQGAELFVEIYVNSDNDIDGLVINNDVSTSNQVEKLNSEIDSEISAILDDTFSMDMSEGEDQMIVVEEKSDNEENAPDIIFRANEDENHTTQAKSSCKIVENPKDYTEFDVEELIPDSMDVDCRETDISELDHINDCYALKPDKLDDKLNPFPCKENSTEDKEILFNLNDIRNDVNGEDDEIFASDSEISEVESHYLNPNFLCDLSIESNDEKLHVSEFERMESIDLCPEKPETEIRESEASFLYEDDGDNNKNTSLENETFQVPFEMFVDDIEPIYESEELQISNYLLDLSETDCSVEQSDWFEKERHKIIYLTKREIKNQELNQSKPFSLRPPRFLLPEPDPESETVDLRHQTMDDRRNSEEWMLDYALRQAVNKLSHARKRKVTLLVEAFEAVSPLSKCDPHVHFSAADFSHIIPIQACQ